MNKRTISAHVLLKNESKFVWYSVMSVLSYVDEIKIWDTGSTDNSKKIIQEILKLKIWKSKVSFKEKFSERFDEALERQLMLDETKTDWVLVLDADEIWWNDSIKKVIDLIHEKGDGLDSVVVPSVNLVGDMYHYQEPQAGRYRLSGKVGHYALRLINRHIPGLQSLKPHGQWGWADGDSVMIQDRDSKRIAFIDAPYIHTTHLRRSDSKIYDQQVLKRSNKIKHELGFNFPSDFYYPEVFFKERPSIVESPWQVMSPQFKIRSMFETPLRKINRRLLPWKVGY